MVAGAAVLALAACGSGGESKSESSSDNSGKTEITWWAFPVFTQEKADDGVEPTKNQCAAFEKKASQISSQTRNHRFPSGLKRLRHLSKWNCSDVLFDSTRADYSMVNWLANDLFTEDFCKRCQQRQYHPS